jgi:hypothetical protein|tara:strand:+ start:792 stop:992 length:201 start_codon:yes stop_codon:yes gene_type:complete
MNGIKFPSVRTFWLVFKNEEVTAFTCGYTEPTQETLAIHRFETYTNEQEWIIACEENGLTPILPNE